MLGGKSISCSRSHSMKLCGIADRRQPPYRRFWHKGEGCGRHRHERLSGQVAYKAQLSP